MNRTCLLQNKNEAELIRRVSGSGIDRILHKAVETLASKGIPSVLVGGLAVQEHGYPRFTKDIDLVVPDPSLAYQVLLAAGFHRSKYPNTVIDTSGVEVDLLQAGDRLNGSKVPFPTPQEVNAEPILVGLKYLLDLKLGSYASAPFQRTQDLADVVELIKRNKLDREFLNGAVKESLYQDLWDKINA